MKKLLVLAMSLGIILAMPMAAGATEVTTPDYDLTDPSPDMPYPDVPGDKDPETPGDDDPDMPYPNVPGDKDSDGNVEDDPDLAYPNTGKNDPTKSPKTGDTTKAGAAAAVVVIAGGVAYFAGRKLKRA